MNLPRAFSISAFTVTRFRRMTVASERTCSFVIWPSCAATTRVTRSTSAGVICAPALFGGGFRRLFVIASLTTFGRSFIASRLAALRFFRRSSFVGGCFGPGPSFVRTSVPSGSRRFWRARKPSRPIFRLSSDRGGSRSQSRGMVLSYAPMDIHTEPEYALEPIVLLDIQTLTGLCPLTLSPQDTVKITATEIRVTYHDRPDKKWVAELRNVVWWAMATESRRVPITGAESTPTPAPTGPDADARPRFARPTSPARPLATTRSRRG